MASEMRVVSLTGDGRYVNLEGGGVEITLECIDRVDLAPGDRVVWSAMSGTMTRVSDGKLYSACAPIRSDGARTWARPAERETLE